MEESGKFIFWGSNSSEKIFQNAFFKGEILNINFEQFWIFIGGSSVENVFFEGAIFENILINT